MITTFRPADRSPGFATKPFQVRTLPADQPVRSFLPMRGDFNTTRGDCVARMGAAGGVGLGWWVQIRVGRRSSCPDPVSGQRSLPLE